MSVPQHDPSQQGASASEAPGWLAPTEPIRACIVTEPSRRESEQLPLLRREARDDTTREAAREVPVRLHPFPHEEGVDRAPVAIGPVPAAGVPDATAVGDQAARRRFDEDRLGLGAFEPARIARPRAILTSRHEAGAAALAREVIEGVEGVDGDDRPADGLG